MVMQTPRLLASLRNAEMPTSRSSLSRHPVLRQVKAHLQQRQALEAKRKHTGAFLWKFYKSFLSKDTL